MFHKYPQELLRGWLRQHNIRDDQVTSLVYLYWDESMLQSRSGVTCAGWTHAGGVLRAAAHAAGDEQEPPGRPARAACMSADPVYTMIGCRG